MGTNWPSRQLFPRKGDTFFAPTPYSFVVEKVEGHRSFEDLAVPLLESLYNFAHWLARDRTEAEDLVQETYVKALKGFHSFVPGTNFRAWMFRILRNTFLTSRTGLKQHVPFAEEAGDGGVDPPATEETPESLLLSRADIARVQNAIETLPMPFREAILLREVEEMSYAEMAETLSVPIGTVMSRLARARHALREALKGGTGR
jgi:RNA polymerase sigma-70 factor (ECF subfamily)